MVAIVFGIACLLLIDVLCSFAVICVRLLFVVCFDLWV